MPWWHRSMCGLHLKKRLMINMKSYFKNKNALDDTINNDYFFRLISSFIIWPLPSVNFSVPLLHQTNCNCNCWGSEPKLPNNPQAAKIENCQHSAKSSCTVQFLNVLYLPSRIIIHSFLIHYLIWCYVLLFTKSYLSSSAW